MKILVLNAGSSSLKFHLFDAAPDSERVVARGEVERVASMGDAIQSMFDQLGNVSVDAVGHRIVHGGDQFRKSVIIDADVEKRVDELSILAPLHNPHNLEAFRAARERLPGATHVAVFDTAFHHTLPRQSYAYGLPYEYLIGKKIRRYGFHGISHRYVSWKFAQLNGKIRADYRMITCHLGNGCSVCAIDHGQSIDTSMGFTPLEGLIMGTRSGDVDAGAILYLITNEGITAPELLRILNGLSGSRGCPAFRTTCGIYCAKPGWEMGAARLAVDAFCYRVRKYIGAYLAAMNGADVLIFAGGIGENSPAIRAEICAASNLGIAIDREANEIDTHEARQIGTSSIPVWVVPTDEELLIARDTMRCILGIAHE